MKISRIQLKNVATIDSAEIDLPDTGIVSITGNNGEGKSTLIEGVAAALFDRSIRGQPIWRQGQAGKVEVVMTSGLTAERKITRGGTKGLKLLGEGAPVNPTQAKAKAHLAKHVMDYGVWSNACFLSPESVSRFSLATDSERKKILETLLGLAFMVPALKDATKQASEAVRAKHSAEIAVAQAEGSVRAAQASFDGLQTPLQANEGDLSQLRQEYAQAQADLTDAKSTLAQAQKALQATTLRYSELSTEVQEYTRRKAQLQSQLQQLGAQKLQLAGGTCPVCGQDTPPGDTTKIDAAIADLDKAIADADAPAKLVADLEAVRQVLETERQQTHTLGNLHGECSNKEAELRGRGVAMKAQVEREKQRGTEVAVAMQNVAISQTLLSKQKKEATQRSEEVLVLEEVKAAYGVRGVRAHLLTDALAAIESVANTWCASIFGPGIRLRLYEKGDQVHMDLEGIAGGRGYKGCSTGQKRRFDVAILLAFGEVARQSFSMESTTLFADEPFENLDERGREAVAEILHEFAQKHCVVVITHNPDFVRLLRPERSYIVSRGTYRRVA